MKRHQVLVLRGVAHLSIRIATQRSADRFGVHFGDRQGGSKLWLVKQSYLRQFLDNFPAIQRVGTPLGR